MNSCQDDLCEANVPLVVLYATCGWGQASPKQVSSMVENVISEHFHPFILRYNLKFHICMSD